MEGTRFVVSHLKSKVSIRNTTLQPSSSIRSQRWTILSDSGDQGHLPLQREQSQQPGTEEARHLRAVNQKCQHQKCYFASYPVQGGQSFLTLGIRTISHCKELRLPPTRNGRVKASQGKSIKGVSIRNATLQAINVKPRQSILSDSGDQDHLPLQGVRLPPTGDRRSKASQELSIRGVNLKGINQKCHFASIPINQKPGAVNPLQFWGSGPSPPSRGSGCNHLRGSPKRGLQSKGGEVSLRQGLQESSCFVEPKGR